MIHPVGSQPPSVYWRRRLVLLASVVAVLALIALTARELLTTDSGSPGAAGTTSASHSTSRSASHPSTRTSTPRTNPARSTGPTSASPGKTGSSSPAKPTSSAAPRPCSPASLGLAAASDKKKYSVGEQPVLAIVVTNKNVAACVQDLADPQIVLRVYNGESRVWGSHDCVVVPGTSEQTIMGKASVQVSVDWTGLSSRPGCKGARQRVGAGTYTLYASLSGHEGKAAQFTIG